MTYTLRTIQQITINVAMQRYIINWDVLELNPMHSCVLRITPSLAKISTVGIYNQRSVYAIAKNITYHITGLGFYVGENFQ